MARVPIPNGNLVQQRPMTDAKFRAADNGGGVLGGLGAGLQQLGDAGARYAQVQDHINDQMDEASAKQGLIEYSGFRNQQIYTGDNAFAQTNGQQALNARIPVEKSLDDKIGELSSRLRTPQAKQLFDRAVQQERQRDGLTIGLHAVKQAEVWNDQQDSALQGQSGQDWMGAVLRGDNEGAAFARGTLTNSITEQYKRNGLSGAPAELAIAKAVSGVQSGVVEAKMRADPVAAGAYIHEHASDFLPADRAKLENSLYAPLLERQAAAIVDGYPADAAGVAPATPAPIPGTGSTAARMIAITLQTESGNRDYANGRLVTSSAGAQGAMQTMPGTQRDPGYGVRPAGDDSVAEKNRVGRDYLAALTKRYGGDAAKTWAAYNGGPGRLEAAVKAKGDAWLTAMPAETRAYVAKNMAMLGGQATPTYAPRHDDLASIYSYIEKQDLPFDVKQAALAEADKRVARNDKLLARQEEAAYDASLSKADALGDQFTSVGQLGAEFSKASPTQQHTLIERARSNAKAVEEANRDINNYQAMIRSGGTWNPYDTTQKNAVEAGVRLAGGTPQAAFDVWQQTGILAKSGAVALRGGLVATDPKQVRAVANIAGNMVRRNPNAFAGVDGGEDMERAAFAFNHYTYDLGMSPESAAQRVAHENTPEFKSKIKIGAPELDSYRRQIKKMGADDAGKALGGTFATRAQAVEANETYAELTVDALQRGQDLATAQAVAKRQMSKVYGTARNGQLLKYPPEAAYPAIGGSHEYVYKDAAATVKAETGTSVPATNIRLVAIPGVTDDDMRNGRPARYRILYAHTQNGQTVYDVVNGQFAADTGAAAKASAAARQKKFTTDRAAAVAAQAARAEQGRDPTMRPGLTGMR